MVEQGSAEPPSEDLSRLAELHGVATSYSPSPGRTVAASATAVTLALAALFAGCGLAAPILCRWAQKRADSRPQPEPEPTPAEAV